MIKFDDTRKDWGAVSPTSGGHTYVGKEKKTGIAWHWSGNPTKLSSASAHSSCLNLVKAWQNYHMKTNGWRDIGYHVLICPHGRVIEGCQGLDTSAAHAYMHNTELYGVQFMYGEGERMSGAMSPSGHEVYHALVAHKGGPLKEMGHGEVPDNSTACPGPEVLKWYKAGHPKDTGGLNMDKMDIYNAVWRTDDLMKATTPTDDNPFWWPESVLENAAKRLLNVQKDVGLLKEENKVLLTEIKMNRAAFEAALTAINDNISNGVSSEELTQIVNTKVDEALASVTADITLSRGE